MTTADENTSAPTAEEMRQRMTLPVGIVWVCRTCPQQGNSVHQGVDAARHDAGRHALGVHRDSAALAEIELRLLDAAEVAVRQEQRLPDAGVRTLVPVEDPWERESLSELQGRLLCDALGCEPQARHRHRRPA
ncbi:hypothetical protein ACFVHW_11470 [Streptomyces sp. NPDC127110]|uniref:hypothetical protein n=1 Tax=Streptomyces sp. NPDC127110 TaxID=3345362 RepID=UPI003645B14A